MSLQNIKASNRGFTIVELLIVVVVIAILAAITIVSYNGITSRANASSAASNVELVQKVAEAFNSDGGRYPGSVTEFRSGFVDANAGISTAAVKLPSSVQILRPALASGGTTLTQVTNATHTLTASGSATGGTSAVEVFITGTVANSTGGVIISWDYTASPNGVQASSKYTYYGAASASSTNFAQIGS
jgi:prepilin-type N-terminal cleavage/methylation domain-containing protein